MTNGNSKSEAVAWLYERDIDGPKHSRYVQLRAPEEPDRIAHAGFTVTPLVPQAECAPREAQSDQQKQDDLTEVESLAKCEPEEDGSLSVNELFAMQAENAAPTPKLYAHPIASADELIDRGSSK